MFYFIIKRINLYLIVNSPPITDLTKSNAFKEVLILSLTDSNLLYTNSKFNYFNLSNYYLLEKIINNIENQEIKKVYLKLEEEGVDHNENKQYLNNDLYSNNNKTISFFEQDSIGFFNLLKKLLKGGFKSEDAFFQQVKEIVGKMDNIHFNDIDKSIIFNSNSNPYLNNPSSVKVFSLENLFSEYNNIIKHQLNYNYLEKILTEEDHINSKHYISFFKKYKKINIGIHKLEQISKEEQQGVHL